MFTLDVDALNANVSIIDMTYHFIDLGFDMTLSHTCQ